MANINPNFQMPTTPRSLAVATGPTPAGTPLTEAAFRLDKQEVIRRLIDIQLAQAAAAAQQAAVPPAAVQPAAAVPVAGPPRPRVGGIEVRKGEAFAWTGGSAIIAGQVLVEPKSYKAFRLEDMKGMQKTAAACEAALPESHRLSTPDKVSSDTKAVTLLTWINRVKAELEERGMDTPFRIVQQGGVTELYLLEEFGRSDIATVKQWVEDLRAYGCAYDEQNLRMSAKMLMASLDLDMLKKIESDVPKDATGPEVFAAVVNNHQSLSSSAVRGLTERLKGLKLSKEPAENVETFTDKVMDIAKRIQGTGPVSCPNDLAQLIYECYNGCSTRMFESHVTDLIKWSANTRDPNHRRVMDHWETELGDLKIKYRDQLERKQWEGANNQKEKTEAKALVAEIQKIKKKLDDVTKTGGKTGKQSGGGNANTDSRTCYHCGKKGHIKPNCPDKDKPAVPGANKAGGASGGGGTSGGSGTGTSSPSDKGAGRKAAPKEGAPHTVKDSEGVELKWCGTCKRWNSGAKAHLTTEHVKREKAGSTAAGALAVATDDDNGGGSLRLIGGYLASIGKPAKKDSLFYCEDCGGTVCKMGHKATLYHMTASMRKDALTWQCKCEEAWTLVEKKAKHLSKKSALKDQPGHP